MTQPIQCALPSNPKSASACQLHKDVHASRWCVTRDDLRVLRWKIAAAIKAGEIVPSEKDPFDPEDRLLGPTIHTITEQFITPETARAGGMSWALMKHPEGLPCDVFVTHAWNEGIFEFIDKVLESLPWRANNVWCCMLANPQNLDIGVLISDPKQSPFALALSAAKTVLVIPNCKESIYKRLWCSYEAFLAYHQNKVILTARAPIVEHCITALTWFLPYYAVGALVRLALHDWENLGLRSWMWGVPILIALAMSLCGPIAAAIGNRFGAMVSGFLLASMALGDRFQSHEPWTDMYDTFLAALFFIMTEIDRVRILQDAEESAMLRRGYSGTIADAECSVQADEDNIREEIGDLVYDVNDALHVLMEAGMSTPNLRRASKRGVDLWKAAVPFYSTALLAWLGSSRALFGQHWEMIDWVNIVLFFAWGLVVAVGERDRRTFATTAMFKILTLAYGLATIHVVVIFGCPNLNSLDGPCFEKADKTLDRYVFGAFVASLVVSIASVGGVATIPCVGPCLAQILVMRDLGSQLSKKERENLRESCNRCDMHASGSFSSQPTVSSAGGASSTNSGSDLLPAHREDPAVHV